MGLWEQNLGSGTVQLAGRSLAHSSDWCGLHLKHGYLPGHVQFFDDLIFSSPGWPGTHCLDQAGRDLSVTVS